MGGGGVAGGGEEEGQRAERNTPKPKPGFPEKEEILCPPPQSSPMLKLHLLLTARNLACGWSTGLAEVRSWGFPSFYLIENMSLSPPLPTPQSRALSPPPPSF